MLTIYSKHIHQDPNGLYWIDGYVEQRDFVAASGPTVEEAEARWQARAALVLQARQEAIEAAAKGVRG